MPRLNPTFANAVFFLYGKNREAGKPPRGPLGTGAFVGIPSEGSSLTSSVRHIYAVTNYHVAIKAKATLLRVNTKAGKSRIIETDPKSWRYADQGDDLAAIDITDDLDDGDEYEALTTQLFATEEFIRASATGIGEDGFMLGLFATQAGADRNMIAARFGNVSLLASSRAPIKQPNGISRPAHIFDMRSRPGFSGSPVFVYRTPEGDLRDTHLGGKVKSPSLVHEGVVLNVEEMLREMEAAKNTFLKLLGIHAGQFNDLVKVRKTRRSQQGEADDLLDEDDLIREADRLVIPGSMTRVVPAWEVLNLLNLQPFAELRAQRERRAIQLSIDRSHSAAPRDP